MRKRTIHKGKTTKSGDARGLLITVITVIAAVLHGCCWFAYQQGKFAYPLTQLEEQFERKLPELDTNIERLDRKISGVRVKLHDAKVQIHILKSCIPLATSSHETLTASLTELLNTKTEANVD